MKILLIAFALLGCVAAAILPDSATQGPNPQDIATPEPEYIDIDGPEPAPLPQPVQAPQTFSTVPRFAQHTNQFSYSAPSIQYLQPQITKHFTSQYQGDSGYHYRRPVYIRRFYRRFY